MHPDYSKGLLAELARIDQQVADAEALTALECDDATLLRATELLVEARELRGQVEGKLRAG